MCIRDSRLHSGVAAAVHLDGPQWTGIFTHAAGEMCIRDRYNPVYMGKIAYGRRRTEKKQGTRNEIHVVEQSEFPKRA